MRDGDGWQVCETDGSDLQRQHPDYEAHNPEFIRRACQVLPSSHPAVPMQAWLARVGRVGRVGVGCATRLLASALCA